MMKNVNFNFNKSELSPVMMDALEGVIMEFQVNCTDDVNFDVFAVEFPYKFCLRLSCLDFEVVDSYIVWNPRECRYSEIPGTQISRAQPKPEKGRC